jgi:hypothetical protein
MREADLDPGRRVVRRVEAGAGEPAVVLEAGAQQRGRILAAGHPAAGPAQQVHPGAPTAPKVRALAARPQVALTIDSSDPSSSKVNPASRALLVRGLATLELGDAVLDEYVAGSVEGLDDDDRRVAEAKLRSIHRQMVRILIEPYWAR